MGLVVLCGGDRSRLSLARLHLLPILYVLGIFDAEQVWRRVLLNQFDIEEDDDAGNVVHNTFLFLLPSQVALLNYSFCSLLCVLRIEEGLDDPGNFIIRDEFPDAI